MPSYSPNANPVDRLWKFMKQKALSRWHETFEAMRDAVSGVLDHPDEYREDLAASTVDEFHIVEKPEIQVEYREAI